MIKHHIRMKRSPDLRFSRQFAALVVVLFLCLVGLTFYLLTVREQEIERQAAELLKKTREFEQLQAQKDREIEKLQEDIRILREKQKILDIIEEFNPELSETEKTSFGQVIWEESRRYSMDPILLMALIYTESGLRTNARSPKGARGLMQILPSVGKSMTSEVARIHGEPVDATASLYDPEFNIRLGTYYLFKLILRFQDVKTAIHAYNQGPTNVQSRLKRGRSVPAGYYRRIVAHYLKLKEFIEDASEDPNVSVALVGNSTGEIRLPGTDNPDSSGGSSLENEKSNHIDSNLY